MTAVDARIIADHPGGVSTVVEIETALRIGSHMLSRRQLSQWV
jgi:hypothetical protein